MTADTDSGTAEILLYDHIGSGFLGVSAKDIIARIKDSGASHIMLRINSGGGDVMEAQAMYSYLSGFNGDVTVRIDGLAASAASLVAMAGDVVIMPENAMMMIHNPATMIAGEASDLRKAADVLDKVRDTMLAAYRAQTGMTKDEIVKLLDAETWMTAEEARQLNFCDVVERQPLALVACANGADYGLKCGEMIAKISAEQVKKIPGVCVVEGGLEPEQTPAPVENNLASELEDAYQAGVKAERERLRELDELYTESRAAVILRAKYAEPSNAKDVAVELLKADAAAELLGMLRADAGSVDAAITPQTRADVSDTRAADIANVINHLRGYA